MAEKLKDVMTKSHFTVTLFMLLILFMENGFCQNGDEWPVEDNNYIYLATNVLNFKHIASFGIWNPKRHIGLNSTVSYYRDVTSSNWFEFVPDSEYVEPGPSFLSLSATFRFRPESNMNVFTGIGLSVNLIRPLPNSGNDIHVKSSDFSARPKPNTIQYEYPYSTLVIENGFYISAKDRPFIVGMMLAWHPIVTEFWRRDNRLVAKGYYTPLNLQARIEFGLKVNVKDR